MRFLHQITFTFFTWSKIKYLNVGGTFLCQIKYIIGKVSMMPIMALQIQPSIATILIRGRFEKGTN